MKNKKGFTLIEILAVIALIGIIMLLIVPSVTTIFKNAKKDLFQDEVLTLYNNTYSTYITRTSEGDYRKRFCKGKDSTINTLNVNEKDNLYYDILVNKDGEVISLKVSDDNFGITLEEPIQKKQIEKANINESFDINCDEPSDPMSTVCIITNTNRRCRLFNINYENKNKTL